MRRTVIQALAAAPVRTHSLSGTETTPSMALLHVSPFADPLHVAPVATLEYKGISLSAKNIMYMLICGRKFILCGLRF